MNQAQNLHQVKTLINTGEPVLIYFSGENCSVCKVLKPKIQEAIEANFPKFKLLEVKTDIHKEVTSHFTVFSIPTLLVYFDTKEFFRVGRNISIAAFIQDLKRPYTLFDED